MKFEKKSFEQKTLEVIQKFDPQQDYMCLVQTNHFFSTDAYLRLISDAQAKMKGDKKWNL
jgi:hypothetical protein